jgi:hypothetical protein
MEETLDLFEGNSWIMGDAWRRAEMEKAPRAPPDPPVSTPRFDSGFSGNDPNSPSE